MIEVLRADERFETRQPGIVTRHCFSSGAHYDAANTQFGAMVALDEHVLAPGTGFDRHAHRGVDLVSWVLAGTLRHEDGDGHVDEIRPGTMLLQSAGTGIEHTEGNTSNSEPLRFVQLWLLSERAEPGQLVGAPPVATGSGEVSVLSPVDPVELAASGHLHLFVTRGDVDVSGRLIHVGDSVRVRDEPLIVTGPGEALVWRSTVDVG